MYAACHGTADQVPLDGTFSVRRWPGKKALNFAVVMEREPKNGRGFMFFSSALRPLQ